METIEVIRSRMVVIIFSNAAFRTVDGKSSLGYVVMLRGFVLDEWSESHLIKRTLSEGSPLSIEKIAFEKGYAMIQVCLNASEVVHTINGNFNWAINSIISDIKKLSLTFVHVEFSYIPKSLNYAADSLAKLAY